MLHQEGLGPGNGEVVWLKADFSELENARDAAELFMRLEQRLDVLVNNAAQLTGPFEKTKDGLSRHMTVKCVLLSCYDLMLLKGATFSSHFGPYILTRTLLPLLVKTSKEPGSDVRIVTLSSLAHRTSRAAQPLIEFRELKDFNEEFRDDVYPDWSRYCMTKLANVLWMRELQKHLDASGAAITCIPINPGTVNTFASRMPFPFIASILFAIFFDIPEVGAYTSCFAAASPAIRANPEKYKGAFLEPVGIITEPSENAKDDKLAKELWETTESILANVGI
ncbi:hypothetical protein DXG01_007538 [Tephrocybe rancida]|nr:hypothetical protein DXG01_007538 [Tephrocybe rancida]